MRNRVPVMARGFFESYRKYNFPYILVRHKKYLAATGVLKDLAPARYFFMRCTSSRQERRLMTIDILQFADVANDGDARCLAVLEWSDVIGRVYPHGIDAAPDRAFDVMLP